MRHIPVIILCSLILLQTVSCKGRNSLKHHEYKPLNPNKAELDLGYSDSIVLIIDSAACSCVYESCTSLEKKLKQLYRSLELKTKSKGVTVIDYHVRKQVAEGLMDKYLMYPVPVVLVFNPSGQPVYKSSKKFDEKKFVTALN